MYNSRTVSYAYDSRGNRTSMTTPDNRVIQYAYDQDSRLTQITPQAGQAFTFGYDNAGRRTSLAYPNGVTAAYTYDTRSRLTSLIYNTSTNSTIDAFAYTLDNIGNRLTKTDNDYQYAYTYDPTYRVTQSLPNQVSQSPAFSQYSEGFTYDAVGNRLTGPAHSISTFYTQNYSYDYENRLVSASKQVTGSTDVETVTFKYDPFGRRIEKNVSTMENGSPTTYSYVYVYDNEDIILEIENKTQNGTATTTTTAYTHGPGIDEPLSLARGGQTYYYHADGLGSITSMTDSTQAVVNRYAYDSFGAIKKSETVRNAYTFTGREFDSETGLLFLRARYYDPEAGRFVGKDPIGFGGGDVNVYAYVGNGPTVWVDPFGLDWTDWQRNIIGTLEGTTSQSAKLNTKTSYGFDTNNDIFVALPDENLKGKKVEIEVNGVTLVVDVGDVGPWNGGHSRKGTDFNDPYWNDNQRPQAECGKDKRDRKTNKAGIDISAALAKKLGLKGNVRLRWRGLQ